MNETIESRVIKSIAKHLNQEESKVTLKAKIVEDLGADSLDVLELMMNFEQEFGCTIPEEDARKLSTVSDVVNYIAKLEKKNIT